MKNTLLFLFTGGLVSVSLGTEAFAATKKCFSSHITESIEINKGLKKHYGDLSQGESDKILDKLIRSEYVTLIPAAYYDFQAEKFHMQGLDLYCQEFKSLNQPADVDQAPSEAPRSSFKSFNWRFHKENLKVALNKGDDRQIRTAAIDALLVLQKTPAFYCMTRHLIESIYRFAYFIPIRDQQAKKAAIESPKPLLMNMMKLHLLGFYGINQIDLLARPLQEAGIPILCSEVPDLLNDLTATELEVLKPLH